MCVRVAWAARIGAEVRQRSLGLLCGLLRCLQAGIIKCLHPGGDASPLSG